MKSNVLLFYTVYIFILSTLKAQPVHDHYYNYKVLDTNNINIKLNNIGSLGWIPPHFVGASWNQLIGNQLIMSDQGFWVIGKIENFPHLALSQWSSYYSPGPIIDGPAIVTNPQDSLRYRVYKISRGDDNSNPDYAEWPSDLGAPIDEEGSPKLYGDQTLWTVYNGFDHTLSTRQYWNNISDTLPPVPIEVQQLSYSRAGNSPDSIDVFSNVIFFEWTIINKGMKFIDSLYLGLWTDIDFCGACSNFPGVDTMNQLAYCWNGIDSCVYGGGNAPPAVGYVQIYGPSKYWEGDTAIFKGREKINNINLPMSSFHGILDDGAVNPLVKPARSLIEAWNIARGFDTEGNVIIDPTTGLETKFPFSGDPVINTGWVFNYGSGGGAGFNIFSGPVTLPPNDTQWVMMALVPGLGKNRFESIEIMRKKAAMLRSLPYDTLAFGRANYFVTDLDDENDEVIPVEFKLYQNYPNPFNPSTKIKYTIPVEVNGHWSMERGIEGDVKLIIYDILGREIETLVNEEQAAGTYEVNWNAAGFPSGVYFYRLQTGSFSEVKKMVLAK